MRFVQLYLIGYFVLLVGAVFALWQSGVLREIPEGWLAVGAVVAIGLGVLLAVVSHPSTVHTRE